MGAVGATNVGTTKIYFDEKVLTNKPYYRTDAHKHKGYYFDRKYDFPVELEKGEMVGEFNMGSTIVMVFEAPKDFEFKMEHEQVVQMGENITNRCPDFRPPQRKKSEDSEPLAAETSAGETEKVEETKPPRKKWF